MLLASSAHPGLTVGASSVRFSFLSLQSGIGYDRTCLFQTLRMFLGSSHVLSRLAIVHGLPVRLVSSAAQRRSLQANQDVRASLFKAAIAAIYYSSDVAAAVGFVQRAFAPLLEVAYRELRTIFHGVVQASPAVGQAAIYVDWYSKLNEFLQRIRSGASAVYVQGARVGPAHAPVWSGELLYRGALLATVEPYDVMGTWKDVKQQ